MSLCMFMLLSTLDWLCVCVCACVCVCVCVCGGGGGGAHTHTSVPSLRQRSSSSVFTKQSISHSGCKLSQNQCCFLLLKSDRVWYMLTLAHLDQTAVSEGNVETCGAAAEHTRSSKPRSWMGRVQIKQKQKLALQKMFMDTLRAARAGRTMTNKYKIWSGTYPSLVFTFQSKATRVLEQDEQIFRQERIQRERNKKGWLTEKERQGGRQGAWGRMGGEGVEGGGLPAAKLQSPTCHPHYLTFQPHRAHHHIIIPVCCMCEPLSGQMNYWCCSQIVNVEFSTGSKGVCHSLSSGKMVTW